MSQPCRALYIFLRINNIPFEDKEIALRKGENINNNIIHIYCNLYNLDSRIDLSSSCQYPKIIMHDEPCSCQVQLERALLST